MSFTCIFFFFKTNNILDGLSVNACFEKKEKKRETLLHIQRKKKKSHLSCGLLQYVIFLTYIIKPMTRCDFNCVVQRLEIDIYFSCVFLRRFVEMHSLYLHIVQHCHYEVKKNFKYIFFLYL